MPLAKVCENIVSAYIYRRTEGLLTVAKFIYLLYTILIFFDPLTFSRLFERNRPKKRKGCSHPQDLTIACPLSRGKSNERIQIR
jgi:hypothetical protein